MAKELVFKDPPSLKFHDRTDIKDDATDILTGASEGLEIWGMAMHGRQAVNKK